MQHLPKQRVNASIFSIGESHAATAKSAVQVDLGSVYDQDVNVKLVALVLPRLSKARPPKIASKGWPHLGDLELADPSYDSSAKIELIIGADVYGPLLRDGVRQGAPGSPTAQRTVLGWILSGKVCNDSQPARKIECSHATIRKEDTDHEVSELIRRFWEIEELHPKRTLTASELECERNFATTHRRDPDGRYTVRIPFKEASLPDFRSSRTIAVHRLGYLERRLQRDAKLSSEYSNFLQEYEKLGHMVAVRAPDSSSNAYYMPHHPVIRESSTTTKLRVVFNASQKTKDGFSLNESTFVGPALQKDLFSIVLKWRLHRYVFSADIEKMFRQIRIHNDDYQFQRIVWRKEPTAPIKDYALTTVTYGTASAPFLAIRTLQQLATDEETRFPLGAAVLREDFYVDDVLSGAEDLESALSRQREIISLLGSGGFRLRKWIANDPALLQSISQEDLLQPTSRDLQPDDQVRALGIRWNSTTDTFHFQVSLNRTDGPPTKRKELSVIARLFDPLGWLAPVVAKAKIFMQRLWSIQLDWDQTLPEELFDEWETYQRELPQLSEINIPRWIKWIATTSSMEFHGFCDASMHAYAAAVYARINVDERSHIVLLAAKSKVAPLKQISIPRLKLCGAVLLTRLLNVVTTSMGHERMPTYAWTDSKIVLAWLSGHPTRWTCFVANRVSEIQSSRLSISWHHVPSKDNPADFASRGATPSELSQNDLWWHGPTWLRKSPSHWPKERTPDYADSTSEKLRSVHAHLVEAVKEDELLTRYSSIRKLLRVTAYCRRFASNARASSSLRTSGFLKVEELHQARALWIRKVQSDFFKEEIEALRSKQPLPKRSPLLRCNPFIDHHSILRIGGRLRNAPLPYDERHPAIIPKNTHFASLLIAEAHLQTLHGGAQLTWSQLLRRYWILAGRTAVRSHIYSCTVCFRIRAPGESQQMGDLPAARITPSKPFSKTGVDYMGPIRLKAITGRGHRSHKGYVALFVCLATKAIHLEAVTDYSTAAFIAAYRRFVSRRGLCSELWSDNGTNFKGADEELRAMHREASSHLQEVAQLIANDGTRWRFIPLAAPHFGGIWEAGVKSTKHHLRRFIGDTVLTYEGLSTVLT